LAVSPPLVSIFLVSAAILAYEILLMRLLSIIQWHHFAYMVISLALLGFAASGTFLALAGGRITRHFPGAYVGNALLFGLLAPGAFLLVQEIPFNPLELPWDPRQPLTLMAIYGVLLVPFFCGANCICLAFFRFRERIHGIYGANLLGSGAGALGVVYLLSVFMPLYALRVVGMLGLAAGLAALVQCGMHHRWLAAGAITVLSVVMLLPQIPLELKLSPYKGLSQALRVQGAQLVTERSGPLGLVSVVESPLIPFRNAPGLSLNATSEPPLQLGLFIDGDSLSVITWFQGELDGLTYLEEMTSALPYALLERPSALILGAGGGSDVLQSLYHHVRRVDAVELNGQVVDLVRKDMALFSGGIYDRDPVRVHVAEGRGFLAGSPEQYDLIQIGLLDSFSASSAGLYALSEGYLYTIEAFDVYLRHLSPGGILAITRWIKLPPRDTLKLFATAIEALKRQGVANPGDHLALIRSWNTSTLVCSPDPLNDQQVSTLLRFCQDRWFDVAWYPGMKAGEANRFTILERPFFFQAALQLLGPEVGRFLADYPYNLTPATDDQPYFFHFFRWRSLPEFLAFTRRGGLPYVEWGYLVLAGTLLQAALASLLLVLMPLWLSGAGTRRQKARAVRYRFLVGYFLAIGLAFLFIEMAFIQKFILFLSHPIYAVSVVVCAFLVFAGLGSAWSARLQGGSGGATSLRQPVVLAVSAIGFLSVVYTLVLPPVFEQLISLADTTKIVISMALIAPLAFFMGVPFPTGLTRLGELAPDLIPWAWGVNGCASVLSAILATLLAMQLGFTVVVFMAVCLYGLAALLLIQEKAKPEFREGA
jgi:spermidine synthase